VVDRLERDREPSHDVAPARVVLAEERERLAVEGDRPLLGPAAAGLIGRRDEVLHCAVALSRLAPVVRERLV
jgi:hypothetical protein